MKPGRIKLSGPSVALLVIQLALVCSVPAKYLYQRWSCPRVWTRAAAYDPELVMRFRKAGRFSAGCQRRSDPGALHSPRLRDRRVSGRIEGG